MSKKSHLITIILIIIALFLGTAIISPPKVKAATITVNTGNDELDGNSPNGKCSLREAIRNANNNNWENEDCSAGSGHDVIVLGARTHTLTIGGINENYAATGDIDIRDDLTIQGATGVRPSIIQAGTGDPTIDDCGDCVDRVLEINVDSDVYIYDVTIQYGYLPNQGDSTNGYTGGGIKNVGHLSLVDCIVQNNRAADGGNITTGYNGKGGAGGGIHSGVDLQLTRTQVINNRAGDGGDGTDGYDGGEGGAGGGIMIEYESTATILDSNINFNTAGKGGDGGPGDSQDGGEGNLGGDGGGLYCNDCNLSISNSTISNNTTGAGGNGGSVSSGDGNGGDGGDGGSGGGLYVIGTTDYTNTSLDLDESTVANNTTGMGGTGGTHSGTSTVDGDPGDQGSGGGIYIYGYVESEVEASTISGNSGLDGGGINLVHGPDMLMVNSTVSGNNAAGPGGGFMITETDSYLSMIFTTVTQNHAAKDGGGFYNSEFSSLYLKRTIVAENTTLIIGKSKNPDCFGTAISNQNNLIGIYDSDGCGFSPSSVGNDLTGTLANPLDPGLLTLSDNGGPTETHALGKFSPALDHITYSSIGCGIIYHYDQRGVIRFSPCDIGAYEKDQAPHIYMPLIIR